MVSEDDVRWCYQNLLGRQPESPDAVEHHMQVSGWRELVMKILTSEEFRLKFSANRFEVVTSLGA